MRSSIRPRSLVHIASLGTLVAALAACGSLADPLGTGGTGTGVGGGSGALTSTQTQAIGSDVASAMTSAVGLMTFTNASNPTLAPRLARAMAVRPNLVAATTASTNCPSYAPNPPADADADGVPDVVTATFSAASCTFSDSTGGSVQVTGTLTIADPTPDSADIAMSANASNLTVSAFDANGAARGTAVQDGSWSVAASSSGANESYDLTTTITTTGNPTTTVQNAWVGSFTPDQGYTLSQQSGTPPGTLAVAGGMTANDGTTSFTLTLTATTALHYDPIACAGSASPFTSGEVHAAVSTSNVSGYVDVVWSNCAAPTATFVQG